VAQHHREKQIGQVSNPPECSLLAQSEARGERIVPGGIGGFQVAQQAAALPDKAQQTYVGVMVFAMTATAVFHGLEVLVQGVDALRHQSDLNFGGAGIGGATGVGFHHVGFLCGIHRHDDFLKERKHATAPHAIDGSQMAQIEIRASDLRSQVKPTRAVLLSAR